jgi:two-component system, OmpR family, alkaline phosphatase synthesis response regulator PhoP
MTRIALVEDDAAISELVRYNLAGDGYEVSVHHDGESLVRALDGPVRDLPDLFLLDVMLPGLDGFGVLAAIRRHPAVSTRPVLLLTARGTEADKVKGLESGADDYLAKPFGIRELLARVHALLRRGGPSESSTGASARGAAPAAEPPTAGTPSHSEVLRGAGDVVLDDARHRVHRRDAEVTLTNREYELLRHLMRGAGIAYSRDDLLRAVWGFDFAGETRTVDVHVRQLRLKLGDDDPDAPLIETVRGRGYRYRET